MKKSLLLVALPLLLSVSAFAGRGAAKEELFKEDTVAHEEIFGKASELKAFNKAPQIKKAAPTVEYVGFQTLHDTENQEYHVRFIAKVADPDNITEATWTRNVYDSATGSSIGTQGTVSPTGYYETVNNGGSPLTAGAGYGFVVYTLRFIPEENCDDYIVVSLSLTNAEGTTISSTRVASADETVSYTFARNETKFYLKKNGETPVAQDLVTKGDPASNNFASFSLSLNKNDSYFIFGYDGENNLFKTITSNALPEGDGSKFTNYLLSDSSGVFKANYKADYILYLTKGNKLYANASNLVRPLYIYTKDFSWWNAEERWTAINAFNNEEGKKAQKWFYLEAEGNYLKTTEDIELSIYAEFNIVEFKSDATEPDWDKKNNQTGNTSFDHSDMYKDCAYIKDGGYGTFYVEWGERN